MAELFEHTSIGSMSLPNRFVRSATWEGLADKDGSVTGRLIEMMIELVKGEVGLIISSYAFVSPEGQSSPGQLAVCDDRLLPGLRDMAHAVHSAGGKMALQLVHGGCSSNPELSGLESVGPSVLSTCRQAGREDISDIISAFARAAGRAKQAGFDAVQIHAAHGYLIDQFLSPARNRREDAYGGSLQRRARLLYEVYEAVRGAVGAGFPVFAKMSAHDGFPAGVEPAEATRVAAKLDALGIDAIEVSAGTPEGARRGGWDHIMPAPFAEGRFFDYAVRIKAAVTCPVLTVEGWRDPLRIVQALEGIDAVSMCRPFIREPHLAERWRSGDLTPATCISCNKCLDLVDEGRGLGCIFHKDVRGRAVTNA